MADLGSIKVTSPAAGQVVDSGQGTVAAVAGALNTGMEIAGKHVERDMLQEVQAQELLAEQMAQDDAAKTAAPTTPIEGTGIEADMSRIQTLTAAVDQAPSSSHRTKAILEMQGVVNRAKAKFPWAADRLERAGANYINSSTRLAQLGLADSISQAAKEQAQSRIDTIYKHAHDLGVDPTLDIQSLEFARAYDLKKRQRSNDERMERRVQQLAWGTEIQAGRRYQEVEKVYNDTSGILDKLEGEVLSIHNGIFKGMAEVLNTDPNALNPTQKNRLMEGMANWEQEKPALKGRARAAIKGAGDLLDTFPISERGTQHYANAKAAYDQVVADSNQIIDMIDDNNFDYVEAMKLRASVRITRDFEGKPLGDVLLYLRDPAYSTLRTIGKENPLMWKSLAEDMGVDYNKPGDLPDLTPANLWAIGAMGADAHDPRDTPEEQVRKGYDQKMDLPSGEVQVPVNPYSTDDLQKAYGVGYGANEALLNTVTNNKEFFEANPTVARGFMEFFAKQTRSAFRIFGPALSQEGFEEQFKLMSSEGALTLAQSCGPETCARANIVYQEAMRGSTADGVGDTETDVLNRLTSKWQFKTKTGEPLSKYLVIDAQGFDQDGKLDVTFDRKAYADEAGLASLDVSEVQVGNVGVQEQAQVYELENKAAVVAEEINNYIRYKGIRQALLGNKIDWNLIGTNMQGLKGMVTNWGVPNDAS